MNKKSILLILGLAIIGTLAWFTYDLMSNNDSSVETELIDFAIKDVESIDKVIISDDIGYSFEIIKGEDNIWTDKDGGCISQHSVEFILDAIKKIEFKSYLPDAAAENHLNRMQSKHTKVEIFQDGDWTKTWYIGPSEKSHYGQIMLLDSDKYGKSDKPVVMHIKGVNGIISPRFFADPRKWMCTNIFALQHDEIQEVDVRYLDEPTRSFRVTKQRNSYTVFQQDKQLQEIDTSYLFSYLQKFKKIHYNMPNYSLTEEEVDSLKQTEPFCILELEETNGEKEKLRMFRIPTLETNTNEFGIEVQYDNANFWCELGNGKLVKCQYFALNPILLGHIYFPLDLSEMNTGDYQSDPSNFSH